MQYRRAGFFALVAVALVGCGTAATHALGAQPAAVGSAANSEYAQAAAAASQSPAPVCTNPGPTTIPSSYCETSDEIAAGQVLVHSPTLSDSELLSAGYTLTIGPHDSPTISESQALTTAGANNRYNKNPTSAVLGEEHDQLGQPTNGPLVWIVDVSPSQTVPFPNCKCNVEFAIAIINASTGSFEGLQTESTIPSKS